MDNIPSYLPPPAFSLRYSFMHRRKPLPSFANLSSTLAPLVLVQTTSKFFDRNSNINSLSREKIIVTLANITPNHMVEIWYSQIFRHDMTTVHCCCCPHTVFISKKYGIHCD